MDSLEKIVSSNELLSIILNNAFDAIVCYLPVRNETGEITDFKFLYLNDSALNTIYGKKEDYLGKSFLQLFPYAAVDGMFEMFKKTVETGEPQEDVFYYEAGEYKGWYRDSVIKYGNGIIVYFRDVTEQKEMELRLKKLLKEKDILLKETHHRVKNNLQVITSLMNLQADKHCKSADDDHCRTCTQRVRTMANIHQQLYEDENFQSVNLKEFVKEMIASAKFFYSGFSKNINLNFDVDDVQLNLNSSVSLGLIINELLTNAIKHAFKTAESGNIDINLKKSNHCIILSVSDDGEGLPEEFNIENSKTLGLLLVRSLVDQLEGKLRIERTKGTKFRIVLPSKVVQEI